jgi:large subunit ribosomal protein L7/L12
MRCGTPAATGSRYCEACGAAAATICELCGILLPTDAQFCWKCGRPTAQNSMAAASSGSAWGFASSRVILQNAGANKIAVIKVIRELTSLGLKEAKDLADSAPQPLLPGATREQAQQAKLLLEQAGATVRLE